MRNYGTSKHLIPPTWFCVVCLATRAEGASFNVARKIRKKDGTERIYIYNKCSKCIRTKLKKKPNYKELIDEYFEQNYKEQQ